MAKTWFVTGTSSGIGRHLTEQVLASGGRVFATLRKKNALDDLKEKHGDRLAVAELDVTDARAIRSVVDVAFGQMKAIDVVVNNAGYGLFGAGEEVTDEQIDHQIRTNLFGSMHVIRAALPHLRAQKSGRILQISTAGGQVAYPNFSVYHASKWGIEGFVEAVAQEVRPLGIECTIVEPGATRTEFGAALVRPPVMAAYDKTPAGDVRRAVDAGQFPLPGDPAKMARAILASVAMSPAPLRLPLGSDTYAVIHAALVDRLAKLEASRDVALSTDA